jgi:hypothetical protein
MKAAALPQQKRAFDELNRKVHPALASNVAEPLEGFWAYDAKVTTSLPYVVKGLFGKGQIVVFWGPPGSGKSFNVTEMACCIGASAWWRGRRTNGGVVMYVVAESARPYIENRIAALIKERPELGGANVFVKWEKSDADERTEAAQAVTLTQPKPIPITGRESALMNVTGRDGNGALTSLSMKQGGRVWTLVVTSRDGNGGIVSARITEGK